MSILPFIREIRREVPIDAAAGTRHRVSARVELPGAVHQLSLTARIDHKGRRVEQLLCDGVRVERAVLLRLTCPETECPQARAVRLQWDRYHRRAPAPAQPAARPRACPLIEEHSLEVDDQQYTARPARFSCFTPCPNRAHPSMVIEKTGYDLFEHGACVAGGLAEIDGVMRPRLPTLQAAEAFVRTGGLLAEAVIRELRRPPSPS